ncbi:hypothetical protein EV714DRAFT_240503, partial [Schizophyllum commune]
MSATNDSTLTPAQKRQRTMALNRQQAQSASGAAPLRVRNASRAVSTAENEGHMSRNDTRTSAVPKGPSARKRPAPAPAQGAPAPPPKRGRPPATEARQSRAPNAGGQPARMQPRRSQATRAGNPSHASASARPQPAPTRREAVGSQPRAELPRSRMQAIQPQQFSTAPTTNIDVNGSDGDEELVERPPRVRRPRPPVVDDEAHEDDVGDVMPNEDSVMDAAMEEEPEEDSMADEGDPVAEAATFIDDGSPQQNDGGAQPPTPSAAQLFDNDMQPIKEQVRQQSSKASQRRQVEMPQWTPEVIELDDGNDSDTGEGTRGTPSAPWPAYSDIRNARNGRDLPVTQQSPEMRLLIDTA